MVIAKAQGQHKQQDCWYRGRGEKIEEIAQYILAADLIVGVDIKIKYSNNEDENDSNNDNE